MNWTLALTAIAGYIAGSVAESYLRKPGTMEQLDKGKKAEEPTEDDKHGTAEVLINGNPAIGIMLGGKQYYRSASSGAVFNVNKGLAGATLPKTTPGYPGVDSVHLVDGRVFRVNGPQIGTMVDGRFVQLAAVVSGEVSGIAHVEGSTNTVP